MSLSPNGVKLDYKPRKSLLVFVFFSLVEFVLSTLFIITLASTIIFPEKAQAAIGVSKILSYQGRLTDSSGNPLGGSGTNYCFRFSIYDDATVGAPDNKLWPSGTPTSNTVNVVNGVFNVGIGEVDDLNAFNFYDNDTVYLNVEVYTVPTTCTGGSWETLAPRQRIDAAAYARVARDVYGNLLRTDNANNKVQIGTGAGATTPVYLNLDVKNVSDTIGGSCAINGTLWYNSANTRALVCDNGIIRRIGNPTSTIEAIGINAAPATFTTGSVGFSAGNNITLSTTNTNQTITIVGPSQSVQTQNLHNVTLTGNTSGAMAQISSGTMTLAGGNNITLSQAGNAVTISAHNQSVQTQNLHNVTLGGNTAGAMAQISSGTMTLAGGNNITLSQAGNAITISAGAGGGGGIAGIAASNTTYTSGTVVISGGANVTVGANAQTITISAAGGGGGLGGIAVSNSTTYTSGTVVFAPGANIQLQTAGQTISISAAGGGGGGATYQNFQWPPGQASTLAAFSNAYMSFQPIRFDQNVTATRAMIMGSVTISTATAASTATGSISVSIGLYTRNAGTLYSVSSGSTLHTFSNNSNARTASILGLRRISVPININATPGEYWYMVWMRTSTSVYSHGISLVQGHSMTQAFSGNLWLVNNSSRQPVIGQGIYSNTSTAPGSVMSSVAISNIKASTAGWARIPWILFTNYDLN